jgi:hypothetical protein
VYQADDRLTRSPDPAISRLKPDAIPPAHGIVQQPTRVPEPVPGSPALRADHKRNLVP